MVDFLNSNNIQEPESYPRTNNNPQKSRRRRRRRRRGLDLHFSILFSILFLSTLISTSFSLDSNPETQESNSSQFDLNNGIKSEFHESLTLKPLPDGKLLASFSFKISSIQISNTDSQSHSSSSSNNPLTSQNFNLLPRQLIQIARSRNVEDLHLSLNTGRWDYQNWGFPTFTVKEQDSNGKIREVELGEENVGSGAEMLARLVEEEDQERNLERESSTKIKPKLLTRWRSLSSSLAGLFCASLDALDSKTVCKPFYPEIFHSNSNSISNSGSNSDPRISESNSKSISSSTLLHGFLPTENICTENLTPFLKSLPCKNKAGLATLLTPHELFKAGFHGMSIHLWKVDQGSSEVEVENEDDIEDFRKGWKVELNFQVVFSPALWEDIGRRDWSLSKLFKKKLETSCALADTSIIRVLKPESFNSKPKKGGGIKQLSVKDRFVLNPLPPSSSAASASSTSNKDPNHQSKSETYQNEGESEDEDQQDEEDEEDEEDLELIQELKRKEENSFYEKLNRFGSLSYDVSDLNKFENSSLDLSMIWPGEAVFEYPDLIQPPLITAERSFKGFGQERGTIELRIRNNQFGKEMSVVYFEQLPWFLKPLLHTMKTEVVEDEFDESSPIVHFTDDLTLPILKSINYQPSVPRESPTLIEANLRIPATSSIILTYEFEKGFLRYMEHPPDAHRGFDLPPAIIKILNLDSNSHLSSSSSSEIQGYNDKLNIRSENRIKSNFNHQRKKKIKVPKIFTTSSLVELAVPDFSMPYNVIIMTSTVIALFFGSVFNNLVRSYKDIKVET